LLADTVKRGPSRLIEARKIGYGHPRTIVISISTRLTKNGMPDRVLARWRNNYLMRIQMKLIQSAFLVTSLLAFNASAQPTPPPPAPLTPSPSTNQAAPAPPAANRPMPMPPSANRPGPKMPPGLMPSAPKTPPVMPDKDKLSYAIGFGIGGQVKKDKLDVDVDTIATAMKDVLADRPTRLNETEVKEIMTQFQGAMRAKVAADREKQMSENKAKGDDYLAKNAKDPAVKTLPNGLQYKVLKDGAGAMPKPTDTVVVGYKGSLIDGTVFDQKAVFTNKVTGQTIKGWTEILPLMKTGSKWEIVVPPDLGYGARGYPPKISPNSVLIFELELLSIAAPSATPSAPPAPSVTSHPAPPTASTGATTTPVVSGQIIKVPSADELKKGAKIEVITNAPQ
jgi:FKBP-type peptidyl-prolyl cis-trans isomerase FklB